MRLFKYLLSLCLFLPGCKSKPDIETLKKEIINTEKAFEKMAQEKGIAEAFKYFSADNAVILRDNKIIKGKAAIFNTYNKPSYRSATLSWNPDFIEISDCGDMAYTYGKYIFTYINTQGDTIKNDGIFHTIWKKQKDGSWKFVWD
ncbi:nuclear transport factor 2 family protein [Labilibacter sediminis]|nr:nuclear transport factor 2 family protein [Labilibacter sediminis]